MLILRQEPCRSSWDIIGLRKLVNWAYYSLDYRGLCLGHSVLPLPCENRRLSMEFSREIILSFQFKHTDGLYESQYRRVFYSYYCRSE